ncbi:MAG: precorrin-2 C(20)-methyltransferase [Nitrospiraceae bacterium]|nr:precorrin-2 C(20)-methyltransferase [Nitrospiraceae bacterium]
MQRKLYVIGIGPGDPELLTLKAVRILNEVQCIVVPKGRQEGVSMALSIISSVIDISGKEIVEAHFPMKKTVADGPAAKDELLDQKWAEAAEAVLARTSKGISTAFITLGDPSIYSTYFYIHRLLLDSDPELEIYFVPGVSSINSAACAAGISLGLGSDRIAVLPGNYPADLEQMLSEFATLVMMKPRSGFGKLLDAVEKSGAGDSLVCVENIGMKGQKITRGAKNMREDEPGYFSVLIATHDKE